MSLLLRAVSTNLELYDPDVRSGASAATITGVSSPAGVDTVAANSLLTITVDNSASVSSVTANGVSLSSVIIVDTNTVTAQVPLGLSVNYGDDVDIVVNNGADSNLYQVSFALPVGYSVVTLTVDYAGLPDDSLFAGNANYAALSVGDIWTYDNKNGDVTFTPDLRFIYDPAPVSSTTIQGWFFDASDNYAPDTGFTTVPVTLPTAPVLPADAVVGVTELTSTAVDGGAATGTAPIVYGVTGSPLVTIDSSTGVITPIAPWDYEQGAQLNLVRTAANGVLPNATQNITVNITNVLENTITDAGDGAGEFAFGGAGLAKSDSQYTNWLASFTDATGNNSASHPDPLTAGTYSHTFTLTDAANVVRDFVVTEGAAIAPSMPATRLANNITGTTAVTTVAATGSPTITYSITGGADAAAFGIVGATGVLTLNSASDIDVKSSYIVEVTASNGFGSDAVQTITLTVVVADVSNVFTGKFHSNFSSRFLL